MKRAIDRYMKENNLSGLALASKIGVSYSCLSSWRRGDTKPWYKKHIKMLKKMGIMNETSEERQSSAIARAQEKQDKKNMLPRKYKRSVNIPDILRSQISSMLDGYVNQLGVSRTWEEFQEIKETFIRDVVYLSRQGE